MERDIAGLSPEAVEQLLRYDWPGNVRELEHAMERGVALSDSGRIVGEDQKWTPIVGQLGGIA